MARLLAEVDGPGETLQLLGRPDDFIEMSLGIVSVEDGKVESLDLLSCLLYF